MTRAPGSVPRKPEQSLDYLSIGKHDGRSWRFGASRPFSADTANVSRPKKPTTQNRSHAAKRRPCIPPRTVPSGPADSHASSSRRRHGTAVPHYPRTVPKPLLLAGLRLSLERKQIPPTGLIRWRFILRRPRVSSAASSDCTSSTPSHRLAWGVAVPIRLLPHQRSVVTTTAEPWARTATAQHWRQNCVVAPKPRPRARGSLGRQCRVSARSGLRRPARAEEG